MRSGVKNVKIDILKGEAANKSQQGDRKRYSKITVASKSLLLVRRRQVTFAPGSGYVGD
ncbi:MAG: hypothetical protein QW461_05455 [Candidatus Jordarchaeales archaeon]